MSGSALLYEADLPATASPKKLGPGVKPVAFGTRVQAYRRRDGVDTGAATSVEEPALTLTVPDGCSSMSVFATATRDSHRHHAPVDTMPPRRSRITGGLAVLACVACCALPLLVAAGVLTTAGAAIAEKTLYAVAAGLVAAALGMWWLHRRRSARRAAAAGATGCGGGGCGC
jgi:mercuric ion transport protein